ncbi:hypothetical protein M405DRAFT_898285, partial [Rhizopogon salebrosus TDB-379]
MNNFLDIVHNVMETTMEATIEEADQRALKAKFAKLKREVIDNVREIFPHGQIIVRGRLGIKGIRVEKPKIIRVNDWLEDVVREVMDTTMEDPDKRVLKLTAHQPTAMAIKGIRVRLPAKNPDDRDSPDTS